MARLWWCFISLRWRWRDFVSTLSVVVRPLLQTLDLRGANGAFELKEHFSAIGLNACCRRIGRLGNSRSRRNINRPRLWLTWMIALAVWWNFLAGQLLVAIKGLFP